ncbi:MAG: hypothetical protein AAB365_01760 [Patescibacteria group bacterium]
MRRITKKIEALIRTNTALFFLCIISIGVLVLIWRGQGAGDRLESNQDSTAQVPVVAALNAGDQKNEQVIAPAFKGMPDPESYTSFVYEGEESLSVSIKCTDDFSVVMIFPMEVDYRSDVLSARYNSAEPCVKGVARTGKISIRGFGLEEGHEYYVVKASQGKKGMWHDPY